MRLLFHLRYVIVFLTLAINLFLSACSKDKLADAEGTDLSKIIVRNKDRQIINTADFKYNERNQLTGISTKYNLGLEADEEQFSYDPSGRYIAYFSTNDLFGDFVSYEFQYDNMQRIKRAVSSPLPANLASDDFTFTYDDKGRIITDSVINKNTRIVTFYHTYLYDDRDNVTEYSLYRRFGNDFQLFDNTLFSYDDKVNPWKQNGLLLFVTGNTSPTLLSKNNVISSTSNGITTPAGYYEYTYYSNGLLRASRQDYNNNGETTEYYYQ